MKKALLLVLSLLLVVSIVACDTTDTSQAGTSSTAPSETSTEPTRYSANVPAGFTLGGRDVIIVTSIGNPDSQLYYDFGGPNPDELVANVINEAAAERIAYVENLLNCVIIERPLNRWGSEASTVLPNEINGGTANYDIVSTAVQEASALVTQDLFHDLYSLENMNNLSGPWWDEAFTEAATINGKLFFATGDISFRNREILACMLFNKEMVSQLDLESPYNLVKNKEWTIDLVIEWSKKVSNDLNADNVIDYNDAFGIGGQNDNIWSMFYGAGEKTVTAQSDGSFAVTLQTDRAARVAASIVELMQNKNYFVCANDYWNAPGYITSPDELVINAFVENRCLLLSTGLGNIEQLRDMEVDFGIVPMPLFDEHQDDYFTIMNPWSGAACSIPSSLSSEEAEDAAVILEVLAAEGKNTIIPAYYEVCLKGQRARDDESQEMLDLILATAGCDSGHIYDWGRVGYNVLHAAISASSGGYISLCQAHQSAIEASIQNTIEVFEKLG